MFIAMFIDKNNVGVRRLACGSMLGRGIVSEKCAAPVCIIPTKDLI